MAKIAVVTGVPGSGKSSLCKIAQALAGKDGERVEVINFGTVMKSLLQKQGKQVHRDAIRKRGLTLQHQIQKEASDEIVKAAQRSKDVVIVDTHMLINTPKGSLPGLPCKIVEKLNPYIIFLVEASPGEVVSRRSRDSDRNRDVELESQIEEEIFFSRVMAAVCSVYTGAAMKIVKNPEGQKNEAAKQIYESLEL